MTSCNQRTLEMSRGEWFATTGVMAGMRTTGQLNDSLPHMHAGDEVSGRCGDQLMVNTTGGRSKSKS